MSELRGSFLLNPPLEKAGLLPHKTIAERTRRVYDRMATVYPVSSFLFHAKAHRHAMEVAGVADGMRVLEVATGSGEMFRRLVKANQSGETVGLDLSPNMAARTQERIRKQFPQAKALLKAVDVRHLPFRKETFDVTFCCYLFELLSEEDIRIALREVERTLKPGGRLTMILIGQNTPFFNRMYHVGGRLAPAFWGRQVERSMTRMVQEAGLHVVHDHTLRQGFYPSRILVAVK